MRKIYILGLALMAMLAFSVVASAVASAETALWLANGAEITSQILSEIDLSWLEETRIPLVGNVNVLCSTIDDGFRLPNGFMIITEQLTLGGGKESPLDCTVESSTDSSLCAVNELVEFEALKLPWEGNLVLEGENFVTIFGESGNVPGFSIECITTKSKDKCEGKFKETDTNQTGGVLVVGLEEKTEKCELGEGFTEGEGEATISSGGPLSVSEP
jgi:hypothetical protein